MKPKIKKKPYQSLSAQAVAELENDDSLETVKSSKDSSLKLEIENVDSIVKPVPIVNSDIPDFKPKQVSRWLIKLKLWFSQGDKVPLTQKIFFLQNLSIMLKAGLSLGAALEALKEQSSNKNLKNILTIINERIHKGESFATALKLFPKTFNELFVNMVESGEVSGNLEEVLKQLHIQLKRDHELVSKVKGAMIYPVIVIVAMLGIGTAMIIFVMPKFISIFAESNIDLPLPTKILIGISNFVQNYGWWVALSLIIIIPSLISFLKKPKGHRLLHHIFLLTPILGNIIKKINLARFARTISSLIKTSIPIVQSFNITSRTLGNIFYREALLDSAEKIKQGSNINTVLREYPALFPPVVTQMITVGEESGSVENILEELAEFYEEEIDQTMKNLPTIIEPVLMLILGVGVAGMAVAILMPMYSLSNVI